MAIAYQEFGLRAPIADFQRDYSFTEPSNVTRICIGELGTIEPYRDDSIRNRSLVVGIADDDRLLLGYPKGSERMQGFHAESANYIADILRGKLTALLHGAVTPKVQGGKLAHVISIFKMDEEDFKRIEGEDLERELPRSRIPVELGKLYPEHFIDPWIAQRLMNNIGANYLEVVFANRSDAIYRPAYNPKDIRSLAAYRATRQFPVEAARYLLREGD